MVSYEFPLLPKYNDHVPSTILDDNDEDNSDDKVQT